MTKKAIVRRLQLSVLPMKLCETSNSHAVIQIPWPKTTQLPWFCLMLENMKLFQIYYNFWDGRRKLEDVREE